jgi:hypothetical protein
LKENLHLIYTLVSSVFEIYETLTFTVCFYSFGMELKELKHSLENCPGNDARQLDDLLSWMELDVKVSCDANLAGISCQRSTCDISMATNLLQQIGYYLMARNLDERVVCK